MRALATAPVLSFLLPGELQSPFALLALLARHQSHRGLQCAIDTEPILSSGTYASSCAGCNVTWSHVLESPYNTTFRVVPSVTVADLFTPRWDDLYLSCSGCRDGVGATMVPSELDLSKCLLSNSARSTHTMTDRWKLP